MVRISSNMSMMLLEAGLSVPRPTRTPSCSRSPSGATPQPELGVALGAVRDGDVLGLEDADVVARHLHAVHGEEIPVEHVPLLQVLDRAHAEGLHEHALPAHLLAVVVRELAAARAHVGELVLALGDVAHDLEAARARERRDRPGTDGSRRCRARAARDRRRSAAAPRPAPRRGGAPRRPWSRRGARRRRRRPRGRGGRADRPSPAAVQRDRAVARVGDRGDARRDRLERAETGAHEVLVGRERRLDVDEAEDPVAELLVVEDAAERRVLEVAVAVDEPGHDDRRARGPRPWPPDAPSMTSSAGPTAAMRSPRHGESAVGEHRRRDRAAPSRRDRS